MRVEIGPNPLHIYFEYGAAYVQQAVSAHPVDPKKRQRFAACIIRPVSEDKEKPAPVMGKGFCISNPNGNFVRVELRKAALVAAMQDAGFDRETRKQIWQAFAVKCRLSARKNGSREEGKQTPAG